MCPAYNYPTAYPAQGPTCSNQMWLTGKCATLSVAHHDHRGSRQKDLLFAWQTVSILNKNRTTWLPATVVHAADHGSYIVQVISGGQYRCACDHICECHSDAIKPDVHTTTDVVPAALPAPATRAVHNPSPPPVAPTTPQPAATSWTSVATCSPWKTPATLHTPQGAQQLAVVWQQTGAIPVALHWPARASKPPTQLIEEMWWWPGLLLDEAKHDDVTGWTCTAMHNGYSLKWTDIIFQIIPFTHLNMT